jgi:nitroreductase
MRKTAPLDHPVHDLIAERWSPVVFDPRPVEAAALRSVLEAARWAASCFNEQPWRYVVGVRGDGAAWDGVLACLAPANQAWARHAPVLMLGVAATTFARNGRPNAHARYDLGQATASLALEATHRGLFVHPMAGFSPEGARERFGIPPDHDPVVALALGHAGDPAAADEALRARDASARTRRPLAAFVHGEAWGRAPTFLGPAKPAR